MKCRDIASGTGGGIDTNTFHTWNSTGSAQPRYVAVKVIRAIDRYREAAKTELRVLQAIYENDPHGQYQCLILQECFDYKNHICIVTDLLGRSVYDFMCSNGVARFPGAFAGYGQAVDSVSLLPSRFGYHSHRSEAGKRSFVR